MACAEESGKETAAVGLWCSVIVQDERTEETLTFTIVPLDSADPSVGRISLGSPLAVELMGRRVGDSINVTLRDGVRVFRVMRVSPQADDLR